MAVSTTAAAAILVVLVTSAASATFAASATSAATHGGSQTGNLFVGRRTHLDDLSLKGQVLSGMGMVKVEHHLVGGILQLTERCVGGEHHKSGVQ